MRGCAMSLLAHTKAGNPILVTKACTNSGVKVWPGAPGRLGHSRRLSARVRGGKRDGGAFYAKVPKLE